MQVVCATSMAQREKSTKVEGLSSLLLPVNANAAPVTGGADWDLWSSCCCCCRCLRQVLLPLLLPCIQAALIQLPESSAPSSRCR